LAVTTGDAGLQPGAGLDGGTAIEGNLNGRPFSSDAALAVVPSGVAPEGESVVIIESASNFPLSCASLKAEASTGTANAYANGTSVQILISSSTAGVTAGSYVVGGADASGPTGSTVGATFLANDSNCMLSASETAISGTVTIDFASTAMIGGSFSLIFGDGDGLSGNFLAPLCQVSPFPGVRPTAETCVH
jgi:hypothetical protein